MSPKGIWTDLIFIAWITVFAMKIDPYGWPTITAIAFFVVMVIRLFEKSIRRVAVISANLLTYAWLAIQTGWMFAWLSFKADYQNKLAIFAVGYAIRNMGHKAMHVNAYFKNGDRARIFPHASSAETAEQDELARHEQWHRPVRRRKNNRVRYA